MVYTAFLCPRSVGYATNCSIDGRLMVAALKLAIERPKPPDCIHRSDRGSPDATVIERGTLGTRFLDDAKAERLIKDTQAEAVYPVGLRDLRDLADKLPRSINAVYNTGRFHSALDQSPDQCENHHLRPTVQ
jgi:putative transposase